MTHGRESNIAFDQHGDDAAPYHWLDLVLRLTPTSSSRSLRLCIGHFDMFSCPEKPTDHQVLREALLLNRESRARVYFDIGFDDRILVGEGEALLKEIADVCIAAGDNGDYILFGTDWIMLANQGNANRYLALAQAAAARVPFWQTRLDKLFSANLDRFLRPSQP